MLVAHTRVYKNDSSFATAMSVSLFPYTYLRKPDSPANLAHIEVLISSSSSPPWRIAAHTLPGIL